MINQQLIKRSLVINVEDGVNADGNIPMARQNHVAYLLIPIMSPLCSLSLIA